MSRARKHLTIPECRGMLEVLAADLTARGLRGDAWRVRNIITHMKRRKPVRMTRPKSAPLTPALKAKIRRLARTTSDSQMRIGLRVGVNSGRVSETLAGKRR
jgi:hypothetical protein